MRSIPRARRGGSFAPLAFATAAMIAAAAAKADEGGGVSPTRLKLPKGPGSLDGIGEDAEPDLNMGVLGYGVPIVVPQGRSEAMTPSLRLAYSSGGGQSPVGFGWSLGVPAIERMTSKGLPTYTQADLFSAGGELVRLPGTNVYRNRFERGFERHTWVDPTGQGRFGYWMTEHKDGRVSYYGARADGTIVDAARVEGPQGVFRYHLVETVDQFGHRILYSYRKEGGSSLLDRIEYVFTAGGPVYRIDFTYEDRQDHISDAKPGFVIKLTKRLTDITVRTRGVQRSRYRLTYEPYEQAGGFSRLAGVYLYGKSDATAFPIRFGFAYTGAPLARCIGPDCTRPYLTTMSSVGVDFAAGNADLIDMNGDALPDVLDTSGGVHLIHLNDFKTVTAHMNTSGVHRFHAPLDSRTAGTGTSLSSPRVQMVDLDGDGFVDLIDAANRRVLWNRGEGDWAGASAVTDTLPDFEHQGANLRFFDYDGDRQIDVMYSDANDTWYYRNNGDGTFSTVATLAEPIGAGFAEGALKLADMNGDGLLDAVRYLGDGAMQYRIYLGYGRWTGWQEMLGLPATLPPDHILTDLNGDGLADVLVVEANVVKYALNWNGATFTGMRTITSADVNGSIPERTGKSIRLADMNGSGSADIVWIDSSGLVSYLELFPMRPNLLNRIDNGIGKVIEMHYGSSASHMARDGGPSAWRDRLPHPMLVIERIETYDTLSGNRAIQEFRYHDGWYDGREKQFRGFARTEVSLTGDDSVQPGRLLHTFDIGKTDEYRHGLLLEKTVENDGKVVKVTSFEYGDCPVAEVPAGTNPKVRHLCQTRTVEVIQEGLTPSDWVTMERTSAYDGYGNPVATANLGITKIGGSGCGPCAAGRGPEVMGEPCGPQCLGDERYSETEFIPPAQAGRWKLDAAYRQRTYGVPGSGRAVEIETYYDGEPFVGLPLGQMTHGLVTRMTRRKSGSEWVTEDRSRYDAHGNRVESIDALGKTTRAFYDDAGFQVVAEEVDFDLRAGGKYTLRMEVTLDPVFFTTVASTNWMRVENGVITSPRVVTQYIYDDFGRVVAVVKPGDDPATPSIEYQYDLADPVSRIVTRQRSKKGGAVDIESIDCYDGMGRVVQKRSLVGGTSYSVDGFVVYSAQGLEKRVYQSYVGSGRACDRAPPTGVRFSESKYDSLNRLIELIRPDGDLFGTPSRVKTQYGPRYSVVWDEDDLDPASPNNGTPTTIWLDGLGRKVKEVQNMGHPAERVTTYTYTDLGLPRSVTDAGGHTRLQAYNLLGHVIRREDPNAGVQTYEYDDAGNRLLQVQNDGSQARIEYDRHGRMLATWNPADVEGTKIEYTYDLAPGCAPADCWKWYGRLVAIRYPVGRENGQVQRATDRFEYDEFGRLVATVRSIDGVDFRFETVFDNADRAVAHRYPSGHRIERMLDGLGRVIHVPGLVQSVSYASGKVVDDVLFANGVLTQYRFDALSRMASIESFGPTGGVIQSLRFAHDRMGRLVEVKDNRPADGRPTGNARCTYDLYGSLTSALLDPGSPHEELLTYTYDALGRMTSKTSSRGEASPEHVGAYVYGGAPGAGPYAPTRVGSLVIGYDPNGHVIRKGADTYAWNNFGGLLKAYRGNRLIASYAYDSAAERIKRSDSNGLVYFLDPEFELRDGIAALYVSLGGRRVARLESAALMAQVLSDLAPANTAGGQTVPEPDGQITAADAWIASAAGGVLPALAAGQRVSAVDHLLRAATRRLLLLGEDGSLREEKTFFHHDYRGSVVATTDMNARVVDRTEYYPFGVKRYSVGANTHDYDFEGRETERSSENTYIGNRYRDLRLAIWLSPDWRFFDVKPDDPPEERVVYGQAASNPMQSSAALGSVPVPAARVVRAVATVSVSTAAGPPPTVRRQLTALAAAVPPKLQDLVPMRTVSKVADAVRTEPPTLKLFVRPPAPSSGGAVLKVPIPSIPSSPPKEEKALGASTGVQPCTNNRAGFVKTQFSDGTEWSKKVYFGDNMKRDCATTCVSKTDAIKELSDQYKSKGVPEKDAMERATREMDAAEKAVKEYKPTGDEKTLTEQTGGAATSSHGYATQAIDVGGGPLPAGSKDEAASK